MSVHSMMHGLEMSPQIKGLVSEQEFERYDRLLLKNTLAVMSDVKYCPRITCGSPVVIDKEESMTVCQVCGFAFCILCMLSYHGVEKCRVKTGWYFDVQFILLFVLFCFHSVF